MELHWRGLLRFRWQEVPIALGLWGLVAAVLFGAWSVLGKLSDGFLGWPLDWDSTAGRWLLSGALLAWTAWCVRGVIRQRRHTAQLRDRLRQDLAAAEVEERNHRFVAARVFEEPEHGGLIYFLRTDRDRVYVHYDQESLERAIPGHAADAIPFRPRTLLVSVQAPRSGWSVGEQWSGDALDAGAPLPINLDPERWPEDGRFSRIPWDRLDQRLASKV